MIIEPYADLLGSRHCTCAYNTETVDPASRPSILQLWHWHGTVRQLKVRFNLKEDALVPSLFPSSCIIYLWSTTFLQDWNFHVHPRLRLLYHHEERYDKKFPSMTQTLFSCSLIFTLTRNRTQRKEVNYHCIEKPYILFLVQY